MVVNRKGKQQATGFSEEEKAAIAERARETLGNKANGEEAVHIKIEEMSEPDRTMARRLHEIVKESAPSLVAKTWYGMPAYANKEGKVVCFFQGAQKFKSRYATLGFGDVAKLDEGGMWPTSFAVTKLSPEVEKQIRALIVKAVS